MEAVTVLLVAASLVVGGLVSLGLRQALTLRQRRAAERAAEQIVEEARAKEKEALLSAKEEALRLRAAAEGEIKERRQELQRQERRLAHKEENLERKHQAFERRENLLATRERETLSLHQQALESRKRQQEKLELVSGMSSDEAKKNLLQLLEEEVKQEASRQVKQWEEEARQETEARARRILAEAIQRSATEVVAETTSSAVHLPSDEMKGRLIGREGRNIRALEQATGVELIVDDTPEVVTLSCFDPVRREVARIALEKLILDGRIHPGRIEEMVEKAKTEVEGEIQRRGEEAAIKGGVPELHPELVKLLGRLHYRTSYGQNVLAHSLEVAYLASVLASELGADVKIAKKAGLLHDLGKGIDHDVEGPHAEIGARLVAQWEKSPPVIQAITQHHGDSDSQSLEGIIVATADAISGARPGARREDLEQYLKRLNDLEKVAASFPGVEKAYALQAGREIRVMVKPQEIDDLSAIRLARDIAKRIEETLQYPGQVKVTLIRETRAVDFAK